MAEGNMKMIDIEDEATNALAMIVIMRNTTQSKDANHKFVEYFNKVENIIRRMRETNMKLNGENMHLRSELNKVGFDKTDQMFEEHLEEIEAQKKPLADDEWLNTPLRNKSIG